MDSAYKILHEQFVSHQNGTSSVEILSVFSLSIMPTLLLPLISTLVKCIGCHSVSSFVLEFFVMVFPMTMFLTSFSDYIYKLGTCLTVIILASYFLQFLWSSKVLKERNPKFTNTSFLKNNKELKFITEYRSFMLILTAFCILAVDFKIFPRRFAKTEVYGYSLMDYGVGSFIFVNALVSPEARLLKGDKFKKALIQSIPLFMVGFGRLISTRATNYHSHISEYGKHWNFFFTIGVIKVFSTTVFSVISPRYSVIVGFIIIGFVQCLLANDEIKFYLLYSEQRDGLISANKEGLFSSLGFCAIYFIGVSFGKLFFSRRPAVLSWMKTAFQLIIISSALSILQMYSENIIEPSSRRAANLTYFLWIISGNAALLSLVIIISILKQLYYFKCFNAMDRQKEEAKKFIIIESVNYNSLAFFLFANLFTGFVNLMFQTIFVSDWYSLLILSSYMLALLSVTSLLYHFKIKLKFW